MQQGKWQLSITNRVSLFFSTFISHTNIGSIFLCPMFAHTVGYLLRVHVGQMVQNTWWEEMADEDHLSGDCCWCPRNDSCHEQTPLLFEVHEEGPRVDSYTPWRCREWEDAPSHSLGTEEAWSIFQSDSYGRARYWKRVRCTLQPHEHISIIPARLPLSKPVQPMQLNSDVSLGG